MEEVLWFDTGKVTVNVIHDWKRRKQRVKALHTPNYFHKIPESTDTISGRADGWRPFCAHSSLPSGDGAMQKFFLHLANHLDKDFLTAWLKLENNWDQKTRQKSFQAVSYKGTFYGVTLMIFKYLNELRIINFSVLFYK